MSIPKELLLNFAGALASATSAPDRYPLPEYMNYEQIMKDLRLFWAEIKPNIKFDLEKKDFIDRKLHEVFEAFESGANERGIDAVLAIYNCNVKNLR